MLSPALAHFLQTAHAQSQHVPFPTSLSTEAESHPVATVGQRKTIACYVFASETLQIRRSNFPLPPPGNHTLWPAPFVFPSVRKSPLSLSPFPPLFSLIAKPRRFDVVRFPPNVPKTTFRTSYSPPPPPPPSEGGGTFHRQLF